MRMFSKIGKFAAVVFAGLAMTAAADDIYPSLDTDLNNFDPTVPVGRYIQEVLEATGGGASTNYVDEATNEVYKSAVEYTDTSVQSAAQSATNYTDYVAQSSTNYTDYVAQSSTNYTDSIASTLRDSIAVKADSTNTYTKAQTDAALADKQDALSQMQLANIAAVPDKRDYNDRSWPISVSNVLSRYDWVCTNIDGDSPDPVPAFTSLRVGDVLESNASASSWGTNSDARLNFSNGQWTYNDDDSLRIRTTGGGGWADTTKINVISDDPFVFLVLSRTNLTYDPVTNYTTFVVETELDAATNAVYSSITNLSHDIITNLSYDATNLLYSQFVYGYPNSQWDGRYMIYTSADPSELVFADFLRENYAAICFRTPSDVPGSLFQIDIEPDDYSPTGMAVTVRNTQVGTVVGTGFISPENPYFEIEGVLPDQAVLHVSSFRSRFADPPVSTNGFVTIASEDARLANAAAIITNLAARPYITLDDNGNWQIEVDGTYTNLETVINAIKGDN